MSEPVYCESCGLPVREEAACTLRTGGLTHQGTCYHEALDRAEKDCTQSGVTPTTDKG